MFPVIKKHTFTEWYKFLILIIQEQMKKLFLLTEILIEETQTKLNSLREAMNRTPKFTTAYQSLEKMAIVNKLRLSKLMLRRESYRA